MCSYLLGKPQPVVTPGDERVSPYLASPPCSRHRPGSVCVVVAAAAKQQITVKPAAAEAVLRSAAAARRFACASLPLSSFFFARASLLCCRPLATLQLTDLPHTGGVLQSSLEALEALEACSMLTARWYFQFTAHAMLNIASRRTPKSGTPRKQPSTD